MTKINENQTSVSETIIQSSQDGFVNAQDEARLSDHCSLTPENSTSTRKVEEIVRVLKEQQSHDLLCPVCGSCITKRVILRKRKRTVSVDRWVQTPDDDAQAALLEGGQQITQDGNDQPETSQEDSDETEAYGCLACFAVFFRRVVGIFTDTYNSSIISYEKLKAGLHKLGSHMDESEVHTLTEAADADGNGTLDYREFVADLLHMQSIDNDEYLRKAFLYFDKDGSGYIEIEEFREALADDFGPDDIDVVNNIFNEVDADKDGKL